MRGPEIPGRRHPRATHARGGGRRGGARGAGGAHGAGGSQREREIAELVARGRTNQQIAEVLFLSPKTVEAHLSRIFVKLGVRSRAAVGARLAAEDHNS